MASKIHKKGARIDALIDNMDKLEPKVSSSNDGFMSAADKEKLDDLPNAEQLAGALGGKQDTIPDLSTIRSGAAAGDTAYQKPGTGIPESDMSDAVKAKLAKAETALQEHQDISGKQDVIDDLPTIRSGAAAGGTAYQKPGTGIPESDLSDAVKAKLAKAESALQEHQDISGKQDVIQDLATIRSGAAAGGTAYQKPGTGIPESDMSDGVKAKLAKAETALQEHQDISGKQDVIQDLATIRSGAAAGGTAYQKPGTGIPASDLSSEVQDMIENGGKTKSVSVNGGTPVTPDANGLVDLTIEQANVTVGTVTTGAAGSNAEVNNSGTPTAPVLDFVIPKGDDGGVGPQGPQGDSAVYNPDDPDTPDFVMANTKGQSTTKAMTQKAVTDELESLNSEVESIKYKSELLFENDSTINWLQGNISGGKIVTNYANRYFILNKPSDVTKVIITKGESTFTLSPYGSSNGTNWTALGNVSGTAEKNVENYTQILFLLWDKPSVSDAQAVPITMTGIHVVVPVEKREIVKKLTDGGDEKVQNAESIKVLSENTYFETLTAENGYRWCQGGIQGSDGTEVTNAKGIRSSWIPVEKDDEVVIKRDGLSVYNLQVVTYDANKNFVISTGRARADLLPTDKGFIRVAFWGSGSGAPAIKPSDAPADVVVILKPKAKEQVKYYHNPIIRADYPDPTVWYGEDGYYYLYATGRVASKTMLRSANLIDWEDTGEIPLTANAISALASAGITDSFWAPCVKKMGNGKWNMYISKPSTGGVAILTSDYPSFGYEFVRFTTAPFNEYIDPDVAVERDNTVWMFAGSAYKIFRRQMTSDGLDFAEGSEWVHVAGRPKDESGNTNRVKTFEGEYLYRRNGYWYLFCSSGQYTNNNYAVRVVRSQTLDGEFVDKEGNAATDGYAEYVIQSNTCLYGPGHNAQIFVDKENRTWMLYHAHWEGFPSTSTRGVCIDEILWDEDGWPYVEGGTPSLCNVAPKM